MIHNSFPWNKIIPLGETPPDEEIPHLGWVNIGTTLKNIHGNASLNDIYNQLEGHEKTKSNEHWKEKVRQTLQRLAKSGVCKNTSRGYWSLAAWHNIIQSLKELSR